MSYLGVRRRAGYGATNAAQKAYGVRKLFCPDCGCPIVTDAGTIAGTFPALFNHPGNGDGLGNSGMVR